MRLDPFPFSGREGGGRMGVMPMALQIPVGTPQHSGQVCPPTPQGGRAVTQALTPRGGPRSQSEHSTSALVICAELETERKASQ